MTDEHAHRKRAGFKGRTRLADAREQLREIADPHGRTETLPVADADRHADGRVLAEAVTASRAAPHYERAAMDGYAVRASDTFGASDRSPEILRVAEGPVGPGEAARVHTGSELPEGADAVVMVEYTECIERAGGDDELELFDAVAGGENVAPVGEDVEAGQQLYDPGHRLRPSDLGMLKTVGVEEVAVAERPAVGVIPTGEEVVQSDPGPGEVVETNGLTISRLVERWGGNPIHREVVTDDADALEAAIQRDCAGDVVVTIGGSSVGERDLLPEVIDDLGELLVHGVALKPGHPVGFGLVEETPVLMLPGYPVSAIVTAVQLLRPLVSLLAGAEPPRVSTTEATLARKIDSEPGVRSFARVKLEVQKGELRATPTRTSGAGVLSSVALADGWVEVPEPLEGIPEGEPVAVQDWEPAIPSR